MLMSPLNGVNKELTGRVSLCAARAGGVMAAVSVCNYTLSRCILAAVVGEQAARRCARLGAGRREKIPAPPELVPSAWGLRWAQLRGGLLLLSCIIVSLGKQGHGPTRPCPHLQGCSKVLGW